MLNFWGCKQRRAKYGKANISNGFQDFPHQQYQFNIFISYIEDVKWNVEEFRNHIFNDGREASLPIALGQIIQIPIKKGCQQSQIMVTGDPIHNI